MRCGPGDLAMVVNRVLNRNLGALVQVIELEPGTTHWRCVALSRIIAIPPRSFEIVSLPVIISPGGAVLIDDSLLTAFRGFVGEND